MVLFQFSRHDFVRFCKHVCMVSRFNYLDKPQNIVLAEARWRKRLNRISKKRAYSHAYTPIEDSTETEYLDTISKYYPIFTFRFISFLCSFSSFRYLFTLSLSHMRFQLNCKFFLVPFSFIFFHSLRLILILSARF